MELMNLTAVELGKKIKDKEVTVEEAVSAAFQEIEKYESDYNCYVTVADKESVLAKAKEIIAEQA